jgi:hypothetical protein
VKKKLSNIIIAILIITVVFISVRKSVTIYYNKQQISSNPRITNGIINDYYEIGIANYYLEYSYSVDGNTYKKEVSPDSADISSEG